MQIRPERPGDAADIATLTTTAFAQAEHSSGTEAAIIARLRDADALLLSLVAVTQGRIVGHVAFSPVTIDGEDRGWIGLGPVSVAPERQRAGIGSALIREGLNRMRAAGRKGCVLLGDPRYYQRFGFRPQPGLVLPNMPPDYFVALPFGGDVPAGEVAFHSAFG
ncbi:putative acetyltransferase [Paracoccus isoporae]|uniref:Putative acetyltransferase n=1 Tax=Paracoccus isoporae TaxID=591205 RepID=A0A1G6TSH2_9RHOB|nr:N-acetyltransferase [Paracoccus isoporae]SDD32020.1 putative acetyltransferase [Paracoccus isoporae]